MRPNTDKTRFKCTGYEVLLSREGSSWSITSSGKVPKSVASQIEELNANKALTSMEMAFFVLKNAVKHDLQYTY